jgi:hypothetical protein
VNSWRHVTFSRPSALVEKRSALKQRIRGKIPGSSGIKKHAITLINPLASKDLGNKIKSILISSHFGFRQDSWH